MFGNAGVYQAEGEELNWRSGERIQGVGGEKSSEGTPSKWIGSPAILATLKIQFGRGAANIWIEIHASERRKLRGCHATILFLFLTGTE